VIGPLHFSERLIITFFMLLSVGIWVIKKKYIFISLNTSFLYKKIRPFNTCPINIIHINTIPAMPLLTVLEI